MLFLCCVYVVSMLFLCCFDFVEIYYEKLVFPKFTRKPTNFFNYIDFIQKLNLVDLQTQGRNKCVGIPDPGQAPTVPTTPNRPNPNKPPPNVDVSYAHFLQSSTTGPTPSREQTQCLQAILERCMVEHQEERQNVPQRSEPFRAILHGVPGAGKSQTLKWIRVFFESICHWSHPQDFAFVAPQNTQAALIEGITLHSFADIPKDPRIYFSWLPATFQGSGPLEANAGR